jgi:hypothetical protein
VVRRRERKAATLQIRPIRSMLSEHARCRPQHLQPPTPSRFAIDVADLQSRGGRAMVRRRRSSVRPDHPLRPFLPHARCRDKALTGFRDQLPAPPGRFGDLHQQDSYARQLRSVCGGCCGFLAAPCPAFWALKPSCSSRRCCC